MNLTEEFYDMDFSYLFIATSYALCININVCTISMPTSWARFDLSSSAYLLLNHAKIMSIKKNYFNLHRCFLIWQFFWNDSAMLYTDIVIENQA